jgi:hypothetical protein
VGGALAQHYIAPPPTGDAHIPNGSSIAVNSEVLKQLTTAVNSLNNNVAAQTSYLTVLNTNLLEQTKALNNMPKKYGDFITKWQEQNSADSYFNIAAFDSSLTDVKANVNQLRSDVDSVNGKVNTLAGQVGFAAEVKNTLEQIAYGIGPADQKATDPLPPLRKSSKDIADALWALPQDHTGTPTSPSISKTQGSPTISAPGSVSPTRSSEVSVATSIQTLAGIVKIANDGYVRGLPVQSVVSKEDSTEIFERATNGAPCTIRWHLESHTAGNVTLSVFDKDCESNPPKNPYELVIDTTWKQVPGTKSEVRWDRTERTKWWSLFDKSAVLALYQK